MLNVSSVLISLALWAILLVASSAAAYFVFWRRSSTKRCMNADATRVSGNAHTCCIARCKPGFVSERTFDASPRVIPSLHGRHWHIRNPHQPAHHAAAEH